MQLEKIYRDSAYQFILMNRSAWFKKFLKLWSTKTYLSRQIRKMIQWQEYS